MPGEGRGRMGSNTNEKKRGVYLESLNLEGDLTWCRPCHESSQGHAAFEYSS